MSRDVGGGTVAAIGVYDATQLSSMVPMPVRFVGRHQFGALAGRHVMAEIGHCPQDGDGLKLAWIDDAGSNEISEPHSKTIQTIFVFVEPRLARHKTKDPIHDLQFFRTQ